MNASVKASVKTSSAEIYFHKIFHGCFGGSNFGERCHGTFRGSTYRVRFHGSFHGSFRWITVRGSFYEQFPWKLPLRNLPRNGGVEDSLKAMNSFVEIVETLIETMEASMEHLMVFHQKYRWCRWPFVILDCFRAPS